MTGDGGNVIAVIEDAPEGTRIVTVAAPTPVAMMMMIMMIDDDDAGRRNGTSRRNIKNDLASSTRKIAVDGNTQQMMMAVNAHR